MGFRFQNGYKSFTTLYDSYLEYSRSLCYSVLNLQSISAGSKYSRYLDLFVTAVAFSWLAVSWIILDFSRQTH